MSSRRHGAEVVADKLREALDRWSDQMTGRDRDNIGELIARFEQIAYDEQMANVGTS